MDCIVHGVAKSRTRLRDFHVHRALGVSQVALVVKNSPASAGEVKRHGFDLWVGQISWRRAWQPIPVFLPGEFHGLYSPWGCKELDTTELFSISRDDFNKERI